MGGVSLRGIPGEGTPEGVGVVDVGDDVGVGVGEGSAVVVVGGCDEGPSAVGEGESGAGSESVHPANAGTNKKRHKTRPDTRMARAQRSPSA